MNIKMFIEFPGILILIGVILLIAAIVVGIIAYKHPDEELVNEELEEKEKLEDLEEKSEEMESSEIEEVKEEVYEEKPVLEETKIEEAADYFAEPIEEVKEEFNSPEEVVIEELPEEKPNIYGGNAPINSFSFNTSNEHKVYGEAVEEDDIELL